MNYFKNTQNQVFAYDDEQVVQGFGQNLTPISEAEMIELTAPPTPTWEQIQAEIDAARLAAYQAEADPLFFKAQRGEATQQEWLDKIAEIKSRYPDPVTEDTETDSI